MTYGEEIYDALHFHAASYIFPSGLPLQRWPALWTFLIQRVTFLFTLYSSFPDFLVLLSLTRTL